MLDELKERLKNLQEQYHKQDVALRQAASNLEAINGAIQEVRYWIGKLEEKSKDNGNKKEK